MKIIRYLGSNEDFPALFVEREILYRNGTGEKTTKKKSRTYLDLLSAFDIETTNMIIEDKPHAFMYIWQWCFYELDIVVYGRTWDEFISFTDEIKSCLPDNCYIVTLVHNLSFEFQFLSGITDFTADGVFCLDKRSVLKADMMEHFELRCTYKHSNMNLDAYTKKWNVQNQKLSGIEYNYKKVRYPWTELTEQELQYCINDVVGLCQAYSAEMKFNGDSLYTVPATSTGYVRREVKRAMQKKYTWLNYQKPNLQTMELLRQAFRGGDTHASRFYSGKTLKNVQSWDRSSSYPDVIINCQFPITKFREIHETMLDKIDILNMHDEGKAVVFRAVFSNLRLRDETCPYPYLSESKCINKPKRFYKKEEHHAYTLDNGRILTADYIECTMTDVDFIIFSDCYTWDDMRIKQAEYSYYGKLPDELLNLVREYYTKKTELKNSGNDLLYDKMKALLNSLYGLMAQNPLRDTVMFSESNEDLYFISADMTDEEKLEKFYKHPYSMYQHGVYVTAWARFRLWQLFKLVGNVNLVYWDTDSVKFVGDADFSKYNRDRIKDSKVNGAFAKDNKGKFHYMGVVEQEETYTEFRTLGAKKYVYSHGDKIGVTVAGVTKRLGGDELKKHGGVNAFKEGFQFIEAGGLMLTYNDDDDINITLDSNILHIGRNVALTDDIYTVGYSDEYRSLLQSIEKSKNNFEEIIDNFDEGVYNW